MPFHPPGFAGCGSPAAEPLVFPGEAATQGVFSPFVAGFERCRSARLSGTGGVEVAYLANPDLGELEFERRNADDRVVVAVTLDAQVAEVRLDGRIVRSGALPLGCATIEQPSQSGEVWTRGDWETMFFFLPTTLVDGLRQAVDLSGDLATLRLENTPARSEPPLLQLARRARAEMALPTPFSRLRADILAQDVGIHLLLRSFDRLQFETADRPARGGLSPGQLRRACEAMDQLLEQDLTLQTLATIAGCSPTHFSRAFKQSTGLAPFVWLLNRRVERAKHLLLKHDFSIAEIALEVGFAAQPQFTTAFRRVTGTTPAAYRRANRAHR